MRLEINLFGKKINLILTIVLLIILVYLAIKLIFPGTDLFIPFLTYISHPVLIFIEKIGNTVFQWTGSSLSIENHGISNHGVPVDGFSTQIMFKKVILFYIIMLWLTRSTIYNKLLFTGLYLILGILSAAAYIIAGANETVYSSQSSVLVSGTYSIVLLSLNTSMFIWYQMNKRLWDENPSVSSRFTKLLEKKLPDIINILYAYAIFYFLLNYLGPRIWIDFILKTSQSLLALLGFDALVENEYLIGNNGSISMYLGCLGGVTMFLFAAVVYLTGNKKNRGWAFIILGLIILNVANIVRIILVFVHLQNHGDYMLATDIHDLYNYITYSIVFILWVIWFERKVDYKSILKPKVNT